MRLLLLSFLLSLMLSPFALRAKTRLDPCVSYLAIKYHLQNQRNELISQALRKFDVRWLNYDRGFEMKLTDDPGAPTRQLVLQDLIKKKREWRSEIWTYAGQSYLFLDVGFKNLEADREYILQLMLDHIEKHPGMNLRVRYGMLRRRDLAILRAFRWAIHDQVISTYSGVKDYLTPEDLSLLETSNMTSTNSDVFALIPFHGDFRWDSVLNPSTEPEVLMTGQITYSKNQSDFAPSLKDVLYNKMISSTFSRHLLPFEYRIRDDALVGFDKGLFSRFERETSCEILRYAKIFKKLPRPVSDRFSKKIYNRVRRAGAKTVFASTDSLTSKIFSRYGFAPYAKLPTESGVDEFLNYLTVESEEYRKATEWLSESGRAVQVRKAGFDD